MWRYVVFVVMVLFCLVLIVGLRIKSEPQKIPFQDLQTILEDEYLDANYQVLQFPGSGGPYRKLGVQKIAPGENVEGTIKVGDATYTLRAKEVDTSTETIIIFLQDESQAVGMSILKPKQNDSQDQQPERNAAQ